MEATRGTLIFAQATLLFCVVVNAQDASTIITTTVGKLAGVPLSFPGPDGYVSLIRYKGIPYAEPLVGPLRFSKPEPKKPWKGLLNATEYGPDCPQPGYSDEAQSEDCLTLNLFVPEVNVSSEDPLAVMIWIHGGGFIIGSARDYDGSVLATVGGVIVVTINYRIGVLGFLTTGDDLAKGNYGLWDQRLAIQWVKEHIGDFYGDPERITIFGESAGGISTAMQAVSPVNDNSLFQRVISESGTANHIFTISRELAASRTRQLGDMLQCETKTSTRQLLECLRNVSADDIVKAGDKLELLIVEMSPYSPTIDGEFFPERISDLIALGLPSQYDKIEGTNSGEGSLALSIGAIPITLDSDEMSLVIGKAMEPTCQCNNYLQLAETAKFLYTATTGLTDQTQNARTMLDMSGDFLFIAPAVMSIRDQFSSMRNRSTSAFMYYFDIPASSYPDLIPGADHGAEIRYVFGYYLAYSSNMEDMMLSRSMVAFWSNFAKYGDPNGDGLPEWPQFDSENETYIILQPNIKIGQHLKADKVAFWNDYLRTTAEPSDPNGCSVKVPIGSGTVQKPGNKTVTISSAEGKVLGSAVGAIRVADEAMGGEEIAEFLGIPYAKPPLGDLRFRPPQAIGPWGDEPLGIQKHLPPACPQNVTRDPWMVRIGFNQTSEDCLTLNIYAPATDSDDISLPVVVFIHPGFGNAGTSSIYDAVLLASQIKAVVVVFNYRLGALGFLSTEDEVAPGNYGLHDALAALEWVNMYIGSFGGDAQRVTIVGHGAGAELAHLLTLSEKAHGLFQRAVLMSSTAISPTAYNQVQPRASEKAKALASALGCPTTSNELMVKCLREKPATDFVLNSENPPFGRAFPIVVDGDILTNSPSDLLKADKVNDVDLIVGMAMDENAPQSFQFLSSNWSLCLSTKEIKEIIHHVSSLSFHNPEMASLVLTTEYLDKGGLGDECETRGSFRRFMQDYLSTWSTLEAARFHANMGRSVYLYLFAHEPPTHYDSFLAPQAGPSYGDDLQFLFGDPYSPRYDELQLSYRLRDKKMSQEIMASLENFIHDGSPGQSLSGAEWPAFDSDNFKFMNLDACPDARSGLEIGWHHTLRFWADLMASVTAPPSPTPPTVTPVPKPCTVGDSIGLKLTPEEATTLIQAMIGVSIGLLVLSVFVFGGCVAYRSRALKSEFGREGHESNAIGEDLLATGKKTMGGALYNMAQVNHAEEVGEDIQDHYREVKEV